MITLDQLQSSFPRQVKTERTKNVFTYTTRKKKGGIVGFAKRRLTCLHCKTVLPKGCSTVCPNCTDKEPLIYQKQLQVFVFLFSKVFIDLSFFKRLFERLKVSSALHGRSARDVKEACIRRFSAQLAIGKRKFFFFLKSFLMENNSQPNLLSKNKSSKGPHGRTHIVEKI